MRYFKTLYGKDFDIALSKLLIDCNCLNSSRDGLASCRETGCIECTLGNNADCTTPILGFIEKNKTKELLTEACNHMDHFAVIENQFSRGLKSAYLYGCFDLPGVDTFCHKEDCIFYSEEEFYNCKPVREAWLKDKVKVYE